MPNMKLFGNQIQQLRNDLQRALQQYYEEKNTWKFAKTRFYRLMAGISMANDPAYANLDKLPEGMDDDAIREELYKRQEKLANDALVQRAAESMDIIACTMKSQWEDPDVPKMRDVDAIQETFDLYMKRELEQVEKFAPMYQGMHGKRMADPNMTAFGATLVRESEKLEEETLPTLNGNRKLSENEMDKVSEQLIQWLANVQMATDPKYKDLKESPDFKEMDNMRKETEAFKSRNRAPYKSLFKRQKTILHIFCGDDSSRWEKGKPKLLRYFEVQESLQTRLKEIEDDMFKARLNEHFKTARESQGEKRSRAIATIIALNNRYEESRKKGKDIDIFDEREIKEAVDRKLAVESFQAVTGGDQLVEFLKTNDVKGLGQELTYKQFEFDKAKKAEKKRAEELRKREEEEQRNALTDEEVAGLDMDKVAYNLYSELAKLDAPLSDAYGNKWSNKVLDAQQYFLKENYKDSNGFKKSVDDTQKFLNTKLSDGKTIADFAKEEKLLGGNFEKLMDRADEITSPTKTAASWIEEHKAELANRIRSNQKGDNYPAADIARIFAARELSKSVRGKKSTLGVSMSEREISKRAAEIMENKSFKDFAAKLSKGENLSKVEAIFKKTHSHGGELDDMFRDYLTKRPAGELKNDPKLKRWMPTVKQRVEFLQSEAAKTQKENKTPYKEAAEILLLRQAADVKRGGKGLEANVPVAGDKGVKSLSEAVEKYAGSDNFQAAFNKPDVKKYILAGHGGEMVERLKNQPGVEQGRQGKDDVVKTGPEAGQGGIGG